MLTLGRPAGIGTVIMALTIGRLSDYYYRKEEKRVGGDYRRKGDEFRLERTRFIVAIPSMWSVLSHHIDRACADRTRAARS